MKTLSRTDLSGMECSAVFSDCDTWRYDLLWLWDPAKPVLTMGALNPSTATHEVLDMTIQGMIKRARSWDRGGFRMLNLFGLRATDPRVMLAHDDPIGPDNDAVIAEALKSMAAEGQALLCGWGEHGVHLGRDKAVIAMAREAGVPLLALEVNKGGAPKHPLYISYKTQPKPWEPPA